MIVLKVNPAYSGISGEVEAICQNFDSEGKVFRNARNKIKTFEVNGLTLNVKSYKPPTVANQFVYKYLRNSKAQRSFEYASKILEMGIFTPEPVAYYETYNKWGIASCFYVSIHQKYDFTFAEMQRSLEGKELEKALRQFARFCFKMHENGLEFLDHSGGNTLFKQNNEGSYDLYLVDINRMRFGRDLSPKKRMENLSRIDFDFESAQLFCDEYAKLYDFNAYKMLDYLWGSTLKFHYRYWQKKYYLKKVKKLYKNLAK